MNNLNLIYAEITNEDRMVLNKFISKNLIDNIKIKRIQYKNNFDEAYVIFYQVLLDEKINLIVFASLIKKLLPKLKHNKFLIFDIPTGKIFSFVDLYDIFSYYEHICDITLYFYPHSLYRKHKKANNLFKYISGEKTVPFLAKAFQLAKKADYFHYSDENKNDIDNLIKYFELNNKYVVIALDEKGEASGMICGYQSDDKTLKMLCHFYDSGYCKGYINNGLYFHFIELCRKNDIEKISFGTTSICDKGLDKFKSYYSTEKINLFSMVISSF